MSVGGKSSESVQRMDLYILVHGPAPVVSIHGHCSDSSSVVCPCLTQVTVIRGFCIRLAWKWLLHYVVFFLLIARPKLMYAEEN